MVRRPSDENTSGTGVIHEARSKEWPKTRLHDAKSPYALRTAAWMVALQVVLVDVTHDNQ